MIKKKIIDEDICKVKEMLREHDFEIPSMWVVVWPVLKFFLLIMLMQLMFCMKYSDGLLSLKEGAGFSLISIAIITLIASLSALNGRARYLCLPNVVRKNSVVLNFLVKKLKFYTVAWVCIYIFSGVYSLYTNGKPANEPVIGLFLGLLFLFFLFNIDMARFELSALNKIYELWKENKL